MDLIFLFDVRGVQGTKGGGIARYCHEFIHHLAKIYPKAVNLFLYDAYETSIEEYCFDSLGKLLTANELANLDQKFRINFYFALSLFVPAAERARIHNVFEYIFPPFLLRHKPVIFGVIYDFIPRIYKEQYLKTSEAIRKYDDCLTALSFCDHLFADSESCRMDAVAIAKVDPNKITTIWGGLSKDKWNSILNVSNQGCLNEYSFDFCSIKKRKYFVYVGSIEWRKNYTRLIKAFSMLSIQERIDHPLLIVCSHGSESLCKIALDNGLTLHQDFFVSGYISDRQLAEIYTHAYCSIFPSLYEGLGLPIIESYFFGTPVIASNTSSMAQIVHPRCTFDPSDIYSIQSKIKEVLNNKEILELSTDFGQHILENSDWSNSILKVAAKIEEYRHLSTRKAHIFPSLSAFVCSSADLVHLPQGKYVTIFAHTLYPHNLSRSDYSYPIMGLSFFTMATQVLPFIKITYYLSKGNVSKTLIDILQKSVSSTKKLILINLNANEMWLEYFNGDFEKMRYFYGDYYHENMYKVSLFSDLVAYGIDGLKPIFAKMNVQEIEYLKSPL